MAASRSIFFFILILCAIFFLSDSNSVPEPRSRVRRAFDSMEQGLLGQLVNLLNTPPELLIQLLECFEQEVQFLNCNFNFSIDPFYVVKQCSLKNDDLKVVLHRIEQATPVMRANLAVPPVVSKDVCFGGIPPNLLASSPDYLDAQPIGSNIAAAVGLIGRDLRNVLDVGFQKLYRQLRIVLSGGTRVEVPPK